MEFHANEDVIELAKSINKAMDVRTKPLHVAIEDFKAELEKAWKDLNGIKQKNKAKDKVLRELLAYAEEGLLIDEQLAAHIEQAMKGE